jgi:chromosome segregation ATPase
MINV